MYNRYVPGHDGVYSRQTVAEPEKPCSVQENTYTVCKEKPEIAQQHRRPFQNRSEGLDLGDLLLLCIVILLLIDCEEEDSIPLMIMAAAFLFLQ